MQHKMNMCGRCKLYNNRCDGEQCIESCVYTLQDCICDVIVRAEAAEAGAEKAEKERDAAIEDMRGICYLCANAKPYSALSRTVMTCAHKEYTASTKYPECKYFKWRGQKEE